MLLEETRRCGQEIIGGYNSDELIIIDHWKTTNPGLTHDFNRFQR